VAALIEVQNASKVFGGGMFGARRTIALEALSFSIAESPPAVTAIVGESGSGKTTLARLMLGLTHPTAGTVRYRGRDIRHLSRSDRRAFRREVQVVFQDPYDVYNPFYPVEHLLRIQLARFGLSRSRADGDRQIEEVLHAVGLRPEDTIGRYPHQLSGGQRQRLMVARALILRPKVIVADEPVSMVDASMRATIVDYLQQLSRDYGVSIVYITHDLATAYQICDNILVLYRGSVVEAGGIEEVIRRPQHAYTRLLIGSIPLPDPARKWMRETATAHAARPLAHGHSCKFADRCPSAFDDCFEQAPPLYRTERQRAVACFLYRSSPLLGGGPINNTFATSRGAAPQSGNGETHGKACRPGDGVADGGPEPSLAEAAAGQGDARAHP
jgi:peptide/nickel transport system ATP-binding protein